MTKTQARVAAVVAGAVVVGGAWWWWTNRRPAAAGAAPKPPPDPIEDRRLAFERAAADHAARKPGLGAAAMVPK